MDVATTESMTISGSGFAEGILIEFQGGSGPNLTVEVILIETDRIDLLITAKLGGPAGVRLWNMLVMGLDGQTTTLLNALIVIKLQ